MLFDDGARRRAELAAVAILPVLRAEIENLGVDVLILVAQLERMLGEHVGVVDLRIEHRRILELRRAAAPSQVQVSADRLRIQTAADRRVGGQSGNAVGFQHVGHTQLNRPLTARGLGVSHAEFKQRGGAQGVGHAAGDLLVDDVDESVAGIGAQRQRNLRIVGLVELAVAVTEVGGRLAVEVVVHAGVALVLHARNAGQRLVVVGGAAGGRRRQLAEDLGGEGSDGRLGNHAVGVDLAGVRVLDRPVEDAVALVRGRHRQVRQGRGLAAQGFEIGKEEGLVLDHRSAEDAAELVLLEDRLAVGRLEISYGIQVRVAQELPCRAVKLIGAALQRHVDDGAAGAPVFGAEVVGLHLEFGNRVGTQLDGLIGIALVAGVVGVVVDAVHLKVIEGAALPVDVERAFAEVAVVRIHAQKRLADARSQQRQVGIVAAVQRQIDHGRVVDDLAAIARIGFQHRDRVLHGDGLRHVADFQRQVHALTGADRDGEVGTEARLESGCFRLEAVGPDLHGDEIEVAGIVGQGAGKNAGLDVFQRDLAADDDRAGAVLDGSQDRSGFKLRHYGDGQCGEQHCQNEESARDLHGSNPFMHTCAS